jgi:hypothetical protein
MACCLPSLCPPLCSVSCCECCVCRPRAGRWKYVYFGVFGLSVVLSWVLRDYYAPRMQFFPGALGTRVGSCALCAPSVAFLAQGAAQGAHLRRV